MIKSHLVTLVVNKARTSKAKALTSKAKAKAKAKALTSKAKAKAKVKKIGLRPHQGQGLNITDSN
jgi:hypothetical protein